MISLSGASADQLWLAARDEFLSGGAAEVEGRGSSTKELRPVVFELTDPRAREGLNNPHLGRNAIGCGSKIRFEDLSER